MKCVLFGQGIGTIDISSLNFTSADQYFVIVNGGGNNTGVQGHLTSKTATSFTITTPSGAGSTECSYQVIQLY